MKGQVCNLLLRIANSREQAYRAAGRRDMAQLRAITRIRNVAGYFSNYPEETQLRAVINLEGELIAIMPAPESRFSKLREKIDSLIQKAYKNEHQQTF
jgi:hypothetical protein